MIRRAELCALAAGLLACSSTVTVSTDPERNYANQFASMPEPRAEVVHSRVEREDVFLVGPRNGDAAWVVYGTSGIHSAHLFVERAPVDPQRVRLFARRH